MNDDFLHDLREREDLYHRWLTESDGDDPLNTFQPIARESLEEESQPLQRRGRPRIRNKKSPQGQYWMCVIPKDEWKPWDTLPRELLFAKGQLEVGGTTGYEHWQFVVGFRRKLRLNGVKQYFGITGMRCELTKSRAANEYCLKEETAVPGTQFSLGKVPLRRASKNDWDAILSSAKVGEWSDIPSDVYIRNYNALRKIYVDNLQPTPIEREIVVFWGRTGVGKSRRAWEEAGWDAYPKNPRSIFWDGYRGHHHVVIDEFRGGVDIAHVLRWFDRYPVIVDIKGSATPLVANRIWITSNLHPKEWYPSLDRETLEALMRRLKIVHFLNNELC